MHDTLDWLASFFAKYGARAICVAAIFAIAGWICSMIGTAKPYSAWLFRLAGLSFVAFILMAIFSAFRL
jgi:hypothetical protein